ncbi:hypothetical protein RJT34_22798 [Clitoria ternatea]|uniref:Histidine kinase domain-containing protein n=1 Tax=Clitoria ternatea TaxID=43366 RepID=A0AAN9IKY0_CLITE
MKAYGASIFTNLIIFLALSIIEWDSHQRLIWQQKSLILMIIFKIALCSLLETELTPELRVMIDLAAVKDLLTTLILAPDLPFFAIGDGKRLEQILLNIVGNAVKFNKEGYVSIRASVAKPESLQDWRPPDFYPASSGHFYMRVQDSGCGILPQDIPHLFTKFAYSWSELTRPSSGVCLALAICRRFQPSDLPPDWFVLPTGRSAHTGCSQEMHVKS